MRHATKKEAGMEEKIRHAMGHLGAALMQVIETDDPIIVRHLRDAERLVSEVWREMQENK